MLVDQRAPVEWISTKWTSDDADELQAIMWACQSQATWEAFILLIALRSWCTILQARRSRICFRSDAKAALGATEKLRSARSPAIDRIMAEISLVLASMNYEVEIDTAHIPGVENILADALSRLDEPGCSSSPPPELMEVHRTIAQVRNSGWWITSPGASTPVEFDIFEKLR